jgi:hypothetical protein
MNKEQQEERKQLKIEKVKKKAARFHKLFTSPAGKLVLQDLEDELNPDVLISSNHDETIYNVGRRDSFIYIQQLIRYEENARRA